MCEENFPLLAKAKAIPTIAKATIEQITIAAIAPPDNPPELFLIGILEKELAVVVVVLLLFSGVSISE